MQTFFGLWYLSRFLYWTQSRWDKTKFTMKAFPTFEMDCHEKHLLLAGVNMQYSRSRGFLWQMLILQNSTVQALPKQKEDCQNQKKLQDRNEELMANHLVLMPEFPETKSRVFRSIPQIRMNTSWTLASALGAGHTMIVDAVLFWNSSVLESLRLMTKNTYLSLG